jgi:hypothetical protein
MDHPDYAAAKAGDALAAVRFVLAMIDGHRIALVSGLFRSATPVIVAVHAEEASGRNTIPRVYGQYLARTLRLPFDDDIVQSNRPQRTGKTNLYRILSVRPESLY